MAGTISGAASSSSNVASLLDLPLLPPPPKHPLIPAIVQLNKVCVLERKRRRQEEGRKSIACRALIETGRCNYGRRCKFAHSQEEIKVAMQKNQQQRPILSHQASRHYRTLPCLKYKLLGACPYEDRCTYLHGPRIDVEQAINDFLLDEEQGDENQPPSIEDNNASAHPPSTSSLPDVYPQCRHSTVFSGTGPSTSSVPYPSTSFVPYPSTSSDPNPSTTFVPYPSTSSDPYPSTSSDPYPAPSISPPSYDPFHSPTRAAERDTAFEFWPVPVISLLDNIMNHRYDHPMRM